MLGIIMAGGIYVPLSDHYPKERMDYICNDCRAKIIVNNSFIQDAMNMDPVDEYEDISPDDLVLIVYTSGSTGKPKGVMHDYKGVTGSAKRYYAALELNENDRISFTEPFYFIAHLFLFAYLLCGGVTYIAQSEVSGDPEMLSDFLYSNNTTVAFISPKVLRFFKKKGTTLRVIVTGSERLSQISSDGFKLLNSYGMTETCAAVSFFEVDKAYDNTPIGKPGEGVCVYILDDNNEPGDEGEICLSGNLGRGYIGLPEQNKKTFTQNPFKDKDGYDILIHTGDLGKRLPDGNILYKNRNDWMIKINGQRVEPGEIESEIRKLDGVKDAVVKDFNDSSGQTFLAAYYIGEKKSEEELKAELSGKLPDYMVPTFFTYLNKFPVNANRKLDRNALPRPDFRHRREVYAAPSNEREESICTAFEAVLDIDHIGVNDDFFALGGDSIKVMRLQKTLREDGIEIFASSVFNAPTPKKLAQTVGGDLGLSSYKGEKADSYPLTRSQMSIYLDCQSPEKETAYNNVFSFFLPNDMAADELRLKNAVETVLNSYPILGAFTKIVNGIPSLVPSGRKITSEIKETEITDKRTLANSINGPFDIENDIPTRAAIFKNPEGLYLVLVMHHIICDGTTISIIARNIAAAYNGEPPATEDMSNFTLAQYETADMTLFCKIPSV